MNVGKYKGVSSKPNSSSRKQVEKMLDAADAQLGTTYSRLPDVEQVNARVQDMGLGVTVYDPIAHLYERYTACLSEDYNMAPPRLMPGDRVAGWTRSIKTCDGLKTELKLQAEQIMARQPDFHEAEKRKAAIDATFDGHDRMIIKAASIDWSKAKE